MQTEPTQCKNALCSNNRAKLEEKETKLIFVVIFEFVKFLAFRFLRFFQIDYLLNHFVRKIKKWTHKAKILSYVKGNGNWLLCFVLMVVAAGWGTVYERMSATLF